MFLEDPSVVHNYLGSLLIIIQLIFLEGILSIDNAAVLGAMVSVLPDDELVPYPKPFKFLQPITNRLFGTQQTAALKVGLLGAYLGRGLMLVMASYVIANPWLRLLGAFYLIKLAFENLGISEQAEVEMRVGAGTSSGTFWSIVLGVELADLAFSIDNVVAAVALSNQVWVVMVGVALGIVTMRFAARIFVYLIRVEPILEQAAYILVLAIGIELVLADLYHFHFDYMIKFMISASILVLCVLYARFPILHIFRPIFYWLGEGMELVNRLVEWILKPLLVLLTLLFSLLRRLLISEDSPLSQSEVSQPQRKQSH